MTYLETYHQPHRSIYIPLYGYFTETELTTNLKLDIIKKIDEGKRSLNVFQRNRIGKEVVQMLEVLNFYKHEGTIRSIVTLVCCVAAYFLGLFTATGGLAVGAIFGFLASGFSAAWTHYQYGENESLIADRRTELSQEEDFDFDDVSLKMR